LIDGSEFEHAGAPPETTKKEQEETYRSGRPMDSVELAAAKSSAKSTSGGPLTVVLSGGCKIEVYDVRLPPFQALRPIAGNPPS
jgi:hypothetical protein